MNETPRNPHPHFDDRGTLHWHARWDEALAQARAENKKLFVEMGREMCSQCRTLVTGIVPMKGVAELLKEHFVALASDADDPERPVVELAMAHLADAMTLPFVLFTDADGSFLDGSHGAVTPERFQEQLQELVAD